MIEILRLGMFVGFLLLGGGVALAKGQLRRRAVHALILYILGIHALLLMAARDAWPLTTYPLITKVSHADTVYRKIVFYGVDAAGREWPADPDSWSPVSPPVLMQWVVSVLPKLPADQKSVAGRFLLARAEQRRSAIVRNERIPKQRFLGPLAAPDWWIYSRPAATSATPFVSLRVYVEEFTPRGKLAGRPPIARTLLDGR